MGRYTHIMCVQHLHVHNIHIICNTHTYLRCTSHDRFWRHTPFNTLVYVYMPHVMDRYTHIMYLQHVHIFTTHVVRSILKTHPISHPRLCVHATRDEFGIYNTRIMDLQHTHISIRVWCIPNSFIHCCGRGLYRVAKTHRMPYLYRSFSAKEPYNQWLFCEKRPEKDILRVFATL